MLVIYYRINHFLFGNTDLKCCVLRQREQTCGCKGKGGRGRDGLGV